MKNVLTKFLLVGSLGLLIMASCKKNDAIVTTSGGTAGTLKASSTNLVLNKNDLNDTSAAITFNFSAAQYGYKAAVTTTLQIDVPGDNWKNPTSATLATNVYTQSYNTSTFNAMVLKLNLPANTSSTIEVRVEYALSPTEVKYSNVLSLAVTPFDLTSWVYVPGDYEGWGNPGAQEDSLISVTGNGVYTGIIDFTGYAGSTGTLQFKIVPVKGSWSVAYGTTTGSSISTSGGNITAPSAAKYIVTVNLNTLTVTMQPADYYSLIGSAAPGTAWTTDTPLKYINDGSNDWVLNNVAMTVGEYKFRLDDAWNISWGPGSAANSAVTSGATGDGNMQLTVAGNYDLTLIQPPTVYQAGSPLSTTTYTAVKQ